MRRLLMDGASVFGRVRHRFRVVGPSPSIIALAPAGEGSLGDQAMLVTLFHELHGRTSGRLALASWNTSDAWEAVQPVSDRTSAGAYLEKGHRWAGARFLGVTTGYDRFAILGADVMDGFYSIDRTVRRLRLAHEAARAGVPTCVVGFSLRATPREEAVEALRNLHPSVTLCVRDPVSAHRVETLTGRTVERVADIAFLLEPSGPTANTADTLSWIQDMRREGRRLLGININPSVLIEARDKTPEEFLSSYVRVLRDKVLPDDELAILLIPHDFRPAHGELAAIAHVQTRLGRDFGGRLASMGPPASAAEMKTVAAQMDLVITGRMHLAIAALGSGTPVACIEYQDKFEGLMELFGLGGVRIDAAAACDPALLGALLSDAMSRVDDLERSVADRLPGVRALAARNVDLVLR